MCVRRRWADARVGEVLRSRAQRRQPQDLLRRNGLAPPAPAASPTGATGHRVRRPEPVLAVGLARNCGGAIGAAVARVSAALAGFEHVQWLVIESDSSDDTVARLEALRREHPGFDFESLPVTRAIHGSFGDSPPNTRVKKQQKSKGREGGGRARALSLLSGFAQSFDKP